MSATVAETVTYAEDSVSPLTVAKPASFGVGQMLVLAIIQHNNPSAQTDLVQPSGWSTASGVFDGVLDDGKVFYYTYTGSDPASWDFPYKSTADVAAFLWRITGADVTTPTLVVSTTPTTSVTSPMDSPSVTPTGTDDLLIAVISDICNGTVLAATAPAGMTDLGLVEVSGHFMSSRSAYQQLSTGSATGVRTWTSVSPTGITGGTWTIAVKSAASGASSATPGPYVVSATVPSARTTPILLRSTLQDPPVLTTPGPLVVTTTRTVLIPRPLTLRATLADPIPLTTPQPYLVSQPARPTPGQAFLSRSSLVDAVVVTGTPTPGPLVVGPLYKPAPVPPVLLGRSTLADPIPQTTPGPYVVSTTTRTPAGVALLLRGSLFDATTLGPYVVTTQTRALVNPVLLLRGSLVDAATGSPYVVTTAAVRPPVYQPILLRSGLADAVAVGTSTPQPYVVTRQPVPVRTAALILAAPIGASCDCTTHRPYTGTTVYGSSGTTVRPNTGITSRPCSC